MMTEQERAELEQAAKPQRWGSKERVALVAEILRQKRIAKRLSEMLASLADKDCGETTPEYWFREAEKDVAREFSPKA